MPTFCVPLESREGPWTKYKVEVFVYADSEEEAKERAFKKLRDDSFQKFVKSMWKIGKVYVKA